MRKVLFFITAFTTIATIFFNCTFDFDDSNDAGKLLPDGPKFGYYNDYRLWSSPVISVCWVNPESSNDTERSWVKEAVENSWDAFSGIIFTHWDTCGDEDRNIKIIINDGVPHTKGLGRQLNNVEGGMSMNFTYENWGCSQDDEQVPCSTKRWFTESKRESWIRTNAIHEFGHALGIAHEHHRDSRDEDCTDEPQGSNGNTEVGPFDRQSIMNYCYNSTYAGKLSYWDIRTIREMYGYGAPNRSAMYILNHKSQREILKASTDNNVLDLKNEPNSNVITYSIENAGGKAFNLTGSPLVQLTSGNSGFQIIEQPSKKIIQPKEKVYVKIKVANGQGSSDKATFSIENSSSNNSGFSFNLTIEIENPVACLYEHANYKGKYTCYAGETYDSWLGDDKVGNDRVSSVRIFDSKYRVTLYKHSNFKGLRTKTYSSDVSYVGYLFNDKASSAKIYKPDEPVACLYEHSNYRGKKTCYYGPTNHFWLLGSSVGNNSVSSVRIFDSSYKVKLYNLIGYRGRRRRTYNSSTSYVGRRFNDKASSARVYKK